MFTRFIIFMVLSLILSGCGVFRSIPHVTTNALVRNISENTASINDAQARATNAIILKNILRARDRWPTSYSTLSGVQSSPRIDFKATGSFSPLGLGNPPLPFSDSGVELSQNNTASAIYTVNPFAKENDGLSVITPIPHQVFESFWSSGWPEDLLLMLLVDSISVKGANDITYTARNSLHKQHQYIEAVASLLPREKCKNFIIANKQILEIQYTKSAGKSFSTPRQTFRHIKKTAKNNLSRAKRRGVNWEFDSLVEDICIADEVMFEFTGVGEDKNESNCPIVETFHATALLQEAKRGDVTLLDQIKTLKELNDDNVHLHFEIKKNSNGILKKTGRVEVRFCKTLKVKAAYALRKVRDGKIMQESDGGRTVKLKLRSIDSIIYYLGEFLRHDGTQTGVSVVKVLQSRDCTIQFGENPDLVEQAVSMFKVYERGLDRFLDFNPDTDAAASAEHAGRHYYAVKIRQPRGNGKYCSEDRSGTTLALLTHLYLRSQSDKFLQGPTSGILRTQ